MMMNKMPALILLLATALCSSARSQEVRLYISSAAGDRIRPQPSQSFAAALTSATGGTAIFRVDDSVRLQKMIGFGASLLEAGMICLKSLTPPRQEEVLRSLFDSRSGAGFSAMKTVIGGTDFMSGGDWFTLDDHPGDRELRFFTVARDLGPTGQITFIKRARKYGEFTLQAPMDYPPDWMLVDVNSNQNLDKKHYDTLARYYLRYVQEYAKNGVVIDYLSLFNEPGVYTKISYPEIKELLKNHVGPLFEQSGLKTRILLSEDPTRKGARSQYPLVLDDPAARKYVAGLAYHGYDFTQIKKPATAANGYDFAEFKNIAELHQMYPELPLWMTEVCYWTQGTPWIKPIPHYDFEDGDFWGRQILADIQAGASGWTYWNMILDQDGGPELISPIHNDPPANKQHPLVIINRKTGQVSYTGAFYYLAHFSKFVRPGSVHIGMEGSTSDIGGVAFHRPDGSRVLQLINSREKDAAARVEWKGKSLALTLPAVSITTLVWAGPK
jgi:glucosylceramidase